MPMRILVVGLDYGTSYSKIVIRNTSRFDDDAKVVTHETCPHGLFPSLIGLRRGNLISPSFPARGTSSIQYLKMIASHVASAPENSLKNLPFSISEPFQALANEFECHRTFVFSLLVFYFSYLIRLTRQFIDQDDEWHDLDIEGKECKDRLVCQLAVPSGLMGQNNAAVEKFFLEALAVAYSIYPKIKLSIEKIPFSHSAKEWYRLVSDSKDDAMIDSLVRKGYCSIYPETAAAVQAYFRSPNSKDGLFITIDIGAGTVDLNAFRKRSKVNESNYYASKVCPLGIANLKARLTLHSPENQEKLWQELELQARALLRKAQEYQPNHGPSTGRRTWDDATLFIFGGGSLDNEYRKLYEKHFTHGLETCGLKNPRLLDLPPAQDIRLPRRVNFGRFAVAYGLSFMKINLDEIKLPDQLDAFYSIYPKEEKKLRSGFNWED